VTRVLILLLIGVSADSVATAHEALPSNATLTPVPIADAIQTAVLDLPLVDHTHDVPVPRPLPFSFLYVTNTALQGFDAYSTLKALDGRATEQNPMMKSVVRSPAGFLALKAGAATLVIVAAERLRKRDHHVAAFLLMLGSNGFMTYVALNNARALAKR
jgi:hypothetical protein